MSVIYICEANGNTNLIRDAVILHHKLSPVIPLSVVNERLISTCRSRDEDLIAKLRSESVDTTSPHLQILSFIAVPEESNTLIDKIRLVPDFNVYFIDHLVDFHVMDDVV